jgi:hypothetical protein
MFNIYSSHTGGVLYIVSRLLSDDLQFFSLIFLNDNIYIEPTSVIRNIIFHVQLCNAILT